MPQRCQIRWEICHLWWEIISHLLGLHQILQMKMTLLLHTLQLLLLPLQLLLQLLLLPILSLLLQDLPESELIPKTGRTTGSNQTTSQLQQEILMTTEILLHQFQNLTLILNQSLLLTLTLILTMSHQEATSPSLRHFTLPTLLLPSPPIPSPMLKP